MSLLSLPIVLGIQQKPTWHRCLYRHRCMEIFSAIPWIWLSFEFLLGRGVEVVTWAAPVSCGKLCSPQDPVVLCLYPMSYAASSSSDSMLGLKQRQQQWWHDMTVVIARYPDFRFKKWHEALRLNSIFEQPWTEAELGCDGIMDCTRLARYVKAAIWKCNGSVFLTDKVELN